MRLTEHFTLAELTVTQTGLANVPGPAAIAALRAWCVNIGEPVRAHFGKPVVASSGFRAPKVNAAVGSKPGSQHVRGEAVDFEIPGVPNPHVAMWIRDHLNFDQLILEAYRKGVPNSGWIHCSWSAARCRRDVKTMMMGSHGAIYLPGLVV